MPKNNMQFINIKDFKEHLCKDCKSKEYSIGFNNKKNVKNIV